MQRAAFTIGVVETPKLRGGRGRFKTIRELVIQREHICLAQLDRLLYHLRCQDFVADFDKDGCAQVLELCFTAERYTRRISGPRGRFPIIGTIFQTAFAVLKDCRKLSAFMVPCDGLTAIEDGNSESLFCIAGYMKSNKTGFRRRSGVHGTRQEDCRGSKRGKEKKFAAVQFFVGNHIHSVLCLQNDRLQFTVGAKASQRHSAGNWQPALVVCGGLRCAARPRGCGFSAPPAQLRQSGPDAHRRDSTGSAQAGIEDSTRRCAQALDGPAPNPVWLCRVCRVHKKDRVILVPVARPFPVQRWLPARGPSGLRPSRSSTPTSNWRRVSRAPFQECEWPQRRWLRARRFAPGRHTQYRVADQWQARPESLREQRGSWP